MVVSEIGGTMECIGGIWVAEFGVIYGLYHAAVFQVDNGRAYSALLKRYGNDWYKNIGTYKTIRVG